VSRTQEEILIQIYKTMPSGEIERRLAGNGLIALARGVADNELQQRRARGGDVDAGTVSVRDQVRPPGFSDITMPVFCLVVSSILLMVVGALIMPGMTLLLSVIAIPALALIFGKAFPRLGMVCGVLLLLATAGLGFIAVFKPPVHLEERLLMYFFFTIVAIVMGSTGVAMIRGTRHKGSWDALAADMSKKQEEQVEKIHKLY